nr:peptidoglycan DD-metalloendopeptidase family protein [Novosphingobium kunmingense]
MRTWFPDREFFMRSQGQVRFIKISSRVQIIAASVSATVLALWLATMAAIAVAGFLSTRDRLALLDREAKVASSESRVNAYRSNLDTVVSDLEKRQDFIDQVTKAHLGDLPDDAQAGETVSNSTNAAAETIKKVSLAVPGAAALARIEARQLAFVEGLTRLADRRAAQASARLSKLGLNPNAVLASINRREAQGGPLLRLATSTDGTVDPRFQRLGLSLARMEALERSVSGVPQVLPASLKFISSGFGYRADPFTGDGAFHAGLDFRGPIGAPIYAAAKGVVSFAGVKAGYGNCIEITHGNGLMTRYAHMSRFGARVGQQVDGGSVIGAIGSTGRSTGPHLHFEVRINDRPVNPRPFLEASPHVQAENRAGRGAQIAG